MEVSKRLCSLKGCDNPHLSLSYCVRHYAKYKKYGDASFGRTNKMHGKHTTTEYKSWEAMKRRCRPDSEKRKYYYERGISVCSEWQDDFERFLTDMGAKPTSDHTIERTDNSRGYEPSNCRWATRKEQAANRSARRLRTVCHKGHSMVGDGVRVTAKGNRLCAICYDRRRIKRNELRRKG